MLKTNKWSLNVAFSHVESMDYFVVGVLAREPLECEDGLWESFPPVGVSKDVARSDDRVAMILVGVRDRSSIAVGFALQEDGDWECLMTDEEKDEHLRALNAKAEARMKAPPDEPREGPGS